MTGEIDVISLLDVMKKLAGSCGSWNGCYYPYPGMRICPGGPNSLFTSNMWDPNEVHSLRYITLNSFCLSIKGIKYTPEGNSSLSLIQLSKDSKD